MPKPNPSSNQDQLANHDANDAALPATCYCNERKTNPKFEKLMEDVPKGYCGFCDICGKPGHMRAHPKLPTTGTWCDEHWQGLVIGRIFGLAEIFQVLFMAGITLFSAYELWMLFH